MGRFYCAEKFAAPLGFAVVIAFLCALYLPFAESPLVFDDHSVLGDLSLFDHAQTPFSPYPRMFPYFTLGFLQVISESNLAWNRYANIVLHGFVIAALYCFLQQCISKYASCYSTSRQKKIVVFVCLWAAINPMAVYGVGYLAQRTILFATLFGLISGALYLRSQQEQRNSDVFSAAFFAALSMLSKEHSILLPVAVMALTPFAATWTRVVVRRALGYLMLTSPCAIWVFIHRGASYIGANYEIYSGDVLSQIANAGAGDIAAYPWLMSAATQLLLFWKYIFLWGLPNPQWMSADMRVDFAQTWANSWAYVGAGGSVLALVTIAVVWWRPEGGVNVRRWAAVSAFTVIPFVVELSAVKVQEPFVLYRSYLWMPAYALLLCLCLFKLDNALLLCRVRGLRYVSWAALVGGLFVLFPCAQDRLRSFSSEEMLWQDARAKLTKPDVAGADRIYYNLAGEAYKRREFDVALALSEKVIELNPMAFQGYLAKGTALLARNRLEDAMKFFDEAAIHNPPANFRGYIEFKRCAVIEVSGTSSETIDCLRRSARLGYGGASFRLKLMGLSE